MDTYKSFETERLLLRPTSLEDAAFILKLLNTPKWLHHIGDRNVTSLKAAEEYIKNRIFPQLERLGYANYTVIRKTDGVKIGSCGLYDRDGLKGIDLGFALLPEHEKQGYGYEAAALVLQAGFEEFGLTHISAITSQENVASQKLLEKLGLEYIKIVRLPKEDIPLLLYKITREKS